MCADHLRSLLMTTPKKLAEDTISNWTPSMAPGEKQGEVRLKHVRISLHLIGFSCRWFSWDQSWMKSAACCTGLCLEGGGNILKDRCVVGKFPHVKPFWETKIVYHLLEIAMDPNGSPEALQQDSSTNQKTLHSLSPSAVSPSESRLSSSQLKVSRLSDQNMMVESFSKVRKLF